MERADAMARGLRSLGVRFGDRVALMLANHPAPEGLLTVERLEAIGRAASTTLDTTPARPEDAAVVMYTSGTTGLPKGVVQTHDNLLRMAYATAYHRAFEDGRRILCALPLYHAFGLVEGLLAATIDLDAGWIRSGDLGRVRPDGYIELTGRSKELYKSGGELVAPKEIEAVLTTHPSVAQSYVVGVPDDRWGEIGCAWVVPAPGTTLDEAELIEFCRARLAKFKVPRHILFIESARLPVTPTGKVQKFRLVEEAQRQLGQD